jgi:hypothetical protein
MSNVFEQIWYGEEALVAILCWWINDYHSQDQNPYSTICINNFYNPDDLTMLQKQCYQFRRTLYVQHRAAYMDTCLAQAEHADAYQPRNITSYWSSHTFTSQSVVPQTHSLR